MYKDTGGYNIAYGEFKEMCGSAWSEKFKYTRFDMARNKATLNIVLSRNAKAHT